MPADPWTAEETQVKQRSTYSSIQDNYSCTLPDQSHNKKDHIQIEISGCEGASLHSVTMRRIGKGGSMPYSERTGNNMSK